MRSNLVVVILAMGILGMVLTIITCEIYRNLALDNQRTAFQELIQLAVEEQLSNIKAKGVKLGLSIQKDKQFRTAFSSGTETDVEAALSSHFNRYFVTTGILNVEKFVAFDNDLNFIAAAHKSSSELNFKTVPCPTLVQDAGSRLGPDKIKPMSRLCIAGDKPYLSVLVPIGGLVLKGYLQVVINPTTDLQHIETKLGMPLSLSYINSETAYKSRQWPKANALKDVFIVDYTLKDATQSPLLSFHLAYDFKILEQKLQDTRAIILLTVSLTTFIAALLCLLMLQKTALSPLNKLGTHLQRVRRDKEYLSEQVAVEGVTEVSSLARDFNGMTAELYAAYESLEIMALTDSLTELPNRDLFYDRLNQFILMNRRTPMPFAVFMMDLDRFKLINETLGHHIGDNLLQLAAARLKEAMRESDTVARLGGDEFAALLPKVTDADCATIVAERIIENISKPFNIRGHNLSVGISIGIVMFPLHSTDTNEIVQRADVAMYYAKHNAIGYAFYDPEKDTYNVLDLTLESELKNAIENDRLQLFYQPKLDLSNNQVYGVEALLRWVHPERGFIPPDSFIPLAERTGLIHPLTQWVLRTALKKTAEWQAQGIFLNMAVNLSACSLRDKDLVCKISTALTESGVSPEYLTLELTESAVMSDPDTALETLNNLDSMGLRLSVDDFGTGYSSLSYLKKLPVDEIKIDRSFVMEMDSDRNDEVIVRSTIDLAYNMGLQVTAEGIENETAWNMLKDLGCNLGQGYYMCRPVDADAFEEWLADFSATEDTAALAVK